MMFFPDRLMILNTTFTSEVLGGTLKWRCSVTHFPILFVVGSSGVVKFSEGLDWMGTSARDGDQ